MSRADDRLFEAAARYLESRDAGDSPKRISVVTFSGRRYLIEIQAPLARPRAAPIETAIPTTATTGPGRWLSPEEELLVKALADGNWHTAQEIADATRQGKTAAMAGLLANLGRREILESSTRHGYRLAVPTVTVGTVPTVTVGTEASN